MKALLRVIVLLVPSWLGLSQNSPLPCDIATKNAIVCACCLDQDEEYMLLDHSPATSPRSSRQEEVQTAENYAPTTSKCIQRTPSDGSVVLGNKHYRSDRDIYALNAKRGDFLSTSHRGSFHYKICRILI